jgi:hypothetical protein
MLSDLRSVAPRVVILLVSFATCVALAGGQQKTRQTSTAAGTKDWNTYRNDEYGIELRYPPDWKVIEAGAYIGFRNPHWDKRSVRLGGPTITLRAWQNISKEKALEEAGIETQAEAARNGDRPSGGFGNETYIVLLGEAGPPTPLREVTINGLPALVADVPTRLYHGDAMKLTRYAHAASGKIVFLMGHHAYVEFHAAIRTSDFDEMVSSFRFTR